MRRSGFTLIELLVALAILVILTAFALAAFRRDDSDRLTQTATLIQSKIEGARSRALSDGRIRGVRLISRADDPFLVDSIQYVGQIDDITGTAIVSTQVNDPTRLDDDVWQLQTTNQWEWARLNLQNIIKVGGKIEFPSHSGNWYVISPNGFAPQNGTVELQGAVAGAVWEADTMLAQGGKFVLTSGNDPLEYRLIPAIMALPNQERAAFPRGIAIDLDSCVLPPQWSTSGATMDILFDAQGKPSGYTGLLHLYLTTLQDAELTRGMLPNHPRNGGTLARPIVPANAPHVPLTPPMSLSVFPGAGIVHISAVDMTDANADLVSDSPYKTARRGR